METLSDKKNLTLFTVWPSIGYVNGQ
jgi:hypothetical protein